jgi:DNA-binding PadR family transcriptional regulator
MRTDLLTQDEGSQAGYKGRSLWELTVLSFLRERPMHPYEMRRLIRERHKEDFLALKRGSLYHAIGRLHRDGLIEPIETERAGRRPERTPYRLADGAERVLITWLRDLLCRPVREPSSFLTAISHLVHVTPDDAAWALAERAARLDAEIEGMDAILQTLADRVGRVNLLEVELARALRKAELEWIGGVIADLRAGRLDWDVDAIFQFLRAAADTASDGKGT